MSTGRLFVLTWLTTLLVACGGGGGGGGNNASLSYPAGTQNLVTGAAITLTPTITGSLTSFTVSPALPAGLTLDSGKGSISGTPTTVTATANYTVSASGSGGAS